MPPNEKQVEREYDHVQERLSSGVISVQEYNDEIAELDDYLRGAYEQDVEDAMRDVNAGWGM